MGTRVRRHQWTHLVYKEDLHGLNTKWKATSKINAESRHRN